MSATIAIAGAGITGLTLSHVLSKAGHTVTVYDPAGFASHNASAQAGGMLAPYSEIEHMDTRWIAAGLAGISFWKNFNNTQPIQFAQNGSYLVAHKDDTYILERFKKHLPESAMKEKALPSTLGHFKDGLFLPKEAHLHPGETLKALANSNKMTFKTEPFPFENHNYDYALDCRGMGASTDIPDLRGVKGESLLVRNTDFTLPYPVRLMHPRYRLYIVPRDNHLFMIGATEIESDSGDHVGMRSAMELMSALYSLHPSFGEADIIDMRSGIRPAYPDNLPRVDVDGNRIICNGMYRHGYLLAPVMADVVKGMIEGQTASHHDLFVRTSHENNTKRTAA